jgi:lipid-binding SYLF domain-containing protein
MSSMTMDRRQVSTMLVAGAASLATAGVASVADAAGESVRDTLDRLYRQVPGTHRLVDRAAGVLVFPTVVKAGFGIGGEYGEGELIVGGRFAGRYNTVSASIGFQAGAQARSVIIVFMTPYALDNFRRVDGWKVGVDGSVALIAVGAGGSIDTNKVTNPIVGFILNPKGLMYNLTLEGSKISRMR